VLKLQVWSPMVNRCFNGITSKLPVMHQAMKEEPPLAAKCHDKFLVQSTIINWEKRTMTLQEIVSLPSDASRRTSHLFANSGMLRTMEKNLKFTYKNSKSYTCQPEDKPLRKGMRDRVVMNL
jgi:hypothetical protein